MKIRILLFLCFMTVSSTLTMYQTQTYQRPCKRDISMDQRFSGVIFQLYELESQIEQEEQALLFNCLIVLEYKLEEARVDAITLQEKLSANNIAISAQTHNQLVRIRENLIAAAADIKETQELFERNCS